eukprot:RCo005907
MSQATHVALALCALSGLALTSVGSAVIFWRFQGEEPFLRVLWPAFLSSLGLDIGVASLFLYCGHHLAMLTVAGGLLTAAYSTLFCALITTGVARIGQQWWADSRAIVSALLWYCHLCVYLHLAALRWPGLRGRLYFVAVVAPAAVHLTAAVLMMPFLPLLAMLPTDRLWVWPALLVFHGLSVVGLWQSLRDSEWLEVGLLVPPRGRGRPPAEPSPHPSSPTRDRVLYQLPGLRPGPSSLPSSKISRPLRVVQLTDLHLGPFMSVSRARKICATIVDVLRPDLVLLTGDFHTPATEHSQHGYLVQALAPLQPLAALGRVFSVLGNHDVETVDTERGVVQDLAQLQIQLLRDSDALAPIPGVGVVHILGLDFAFSNQEERVWAAVAAHPVPATADYSVVLLHDPQWFSCIPHDRCSVVLSGHTHGGQIGLVSWGLRPTLIGLLHGLLCHPAVEAASCTSPTLSSAPPPLDPSSAGPRVTKKGFALSSPDHGLWRHGLNRLYVHRGQGFRSFSENFVLRVGVPNELSLLCLHHET